MPMYEYRCHACEHTFKEMRSIAENDAEDAPQNQPCPECGEMKVQKKIGAPPIAYDGAGRQRHSNDFNDKLKDMRKKLPQDEKLPMDEVIR